MRDELLQYYERELTYLRQLGVEFAERHPGVASKLQLEPGKCEDPHVERLLEGFAFLAARIHLRLDDEFPEITEGLLETIHPHYIRPIPSISLVEFHLDPEQGKLTGGFTIPREAQLYSQPVGGAPCKFRTTQPTTLWPLRITAAQWLTPERVRPPLRGGDAVALLRLEIRCFPGASFEKLELSKLRLYLGGSGNTPYTLYELLLNNCRSIVIRDLDAAAKRRPVELRPSALAAAGFAPAEALLPHPRRSFDGYRLLQEYFAFPQKFLFLDLSGWEQTRAAGMGSGVEVLFLVNAFEREERQAQLEAAVQTGAVRLNCSPVINLFPQTSEPILLNERRSEYTLVADARRHQTTEIHSIDSVVGLTPNAAEPMRFEPFYALRHPGHPVKPQHYWYARRRVAGWRSDGAHELDLRLVDLSGRTVVPDLDALTARLLCFNRDLPARLPFGNDNGDFELVGGGPVGKVIALTKPTEVVRPPLGKDLYWRLISSLSLNHLSIVEAGADGGGDALREILRLHNFSGSLALERQIDGLREVRSEPQLTQVVSNEGMSFARGRRVDILLDEEQFSGSGAYFFAAMLERFLGLYVSLNHFVTLRARTLQRKEVLRQWSPRAGNRTLL
jgi:type VI secretion system protein ImpG